MTIKSRRVPAFTRLLARTVAFALAMGLGISSASAATITVKKILLPMGDTGSFTLQLKNNNSGGALIANMLNVGNGGNMGPVTVTSGTYWIGEVAGGNSTNLSNYTQTISGAGCTPVSGGGAQVVINAMSGNIVCTITNNKIAPATGQLRLKKMLVPSNDPGHFNLFIKDANNNIVTNGQMQNAGHNTTLGPVTVPPGTYNLSETAGFATVGTDYTSAFSGPGCNANGTVSVTGGSNITCTITNTKKPSGTIKVIKNTVPSNIPGALFTLKINNSNGQTLSQWSNGHPSPLILGPVTLTSGSTYTVTEVAGTGTSLANYTTTYSGGCSANGTVNLTAGTNVVCTITNTLISNNTCTGYPLLVTVNVNNPGTPFGPQIVHICRGGKVKFFNNNSGMAFTANYVSGPSNFGSVPVAIANGSSGQTAVLNNPGTDFYLISGGSTLQGQIVIH
jgi:hypothetical protein